MAVCPNCEAELPKTPRDILIRDLAELVAALQVPVSMHAPVLCQVGPIWDRVHSQVAGFGWSDADEIEKQLGEKL